MTASPFRSLRRTALRFAGLFSKSARERDLRAEFDSHFDLHVADNLRRGMTEAEARRDAALHFGSIASASESVRQGSTVVALETTAQDFRYALRGLRRNPGFAAASILSLALGIGASIAVFTLADNLLLRPLPYRDPDRLAMVWETNPFHKGQIRNVVSPANFRDWKAQNHVFAEMAVYAEGPSAFSDGSRVEELGDQYMSAELLPMLGVQPFRGRLFTQQEDLPQSPNVVLISHRLWQSWFGGDEKIVGRHVQLRSRPFTIIGVMPPGFYFRNREIDLWEPLGLDPARDYRLKSGRYLMCVARLKPGIALARAQLDMQTIAGRLQQDYPKFDAKWSVNVEPFRESLVAEVRPSMLALLGAVGLLLAVACANVANLLLARYTARRRELAARAAIGAGRVRVLRQLLTESLTISLTGGLLGLALARAAVRGLLTLAPADLTRNIAVTFDDRAVFFALGVSILTGIVFGLAPSLLASRVDLARALHEDSRAVSGAGSRARSMLVAAEVALAVVLLAGAGLLFRTLVSLQSVDPGLRTSGILTFRVQIPPTRYKDATVRTRFFDNATDSIAALPGVESASAVSFLPFTALAAGTGFTIAGRPPAAPGEGAVTVVRTVLPGYFHTIGIPLEKGRVFNAADNTLDSPYRFIINRALAEKYFPNQDPLGQSISVDMDDKNPLGEIIGVVGNVKEGALDKDPEPTVYYPHAHLVYTGMTFVVRTQGDPLRLAGAVTRTIHSIDPARPVAEIATMDSVVRETFSRQSFSAILLGSFSLASLLLAAVGIYGVLAYSVTERTREIGVRIALGAEPGGIVRLILAAGFRMVLIGAATGLLGALALTRLLKSLLFGVRSTDAATFAAVPIVLIAVALLAAWLPARRAARLPVVDALRAE